jgi:hypothetical protein
MKRQTKIKRGIQIILLVAFAVLVSMPVKAQKKSPEELKGIYKAWLENDVSWIMTGEEAEEFKGKPALELKLSTLTPALCIDSELVLELEITNTGTEAVLINKARLWKYFSYGFSRPDGSGRGGGSAEGNFGGRGEEVLLQPGMIYRSSHKFSLADEFFAEQGNYTLKTDLDSISSNSVEFELFQCGMMKEVEDKDDN